MSEVEDKIVIECITSPGRIERVNRAKYMAMRDALIPVLPAEPPVITVAVAKGALLPALPVDLFPGGVKAG
ncbi:hypothetical protein BH23ACT11_BH23ACT11_07050 [soil metagenome]